MLLRCYRSCASEEVQEAVWLCSEYVHAYSNKGYLEFYIREDRLSFALIIDPLMRHIRSKDFIM